MFTKNGRQYVENPYRQLLKDPPPPLADSQMERSSGIRPGGKRR